MKCAAITLALSLLLASTAHAEDTRIVSTGEPTSMTVAVFGIVLSTAGFGLMLRPSGACSCEVSEAWVVGGAIVVTSGVLMTWMGLRSRTVTVAPSISKGNYGGVAVVRWGR